MGFFQRLFNRSQPVVEEKQADKNDVSLEDWEPVPGYIPADASDAKHVSLIATAIASGDRPESEFVVKRIWQRNPEAVLVTLIASSIASGDGPDSQLTVKNIYRKK